MLLAASRVMRTLITGLLITSALTAGCATKSGTGTAVGAGAGGLAGYAIGGTTGLVIGGLLGGALGYSVGHEMDKDDERRAAEALEYNRQMEWRNSHGTHYRIVPTQTSYREGRECRDYRLLAEVDGQPDEVTGTACRRSDGSWEQISG